MGTTAPVASQQEKASAAKPHRLATASKVASRVQAWVRAPASAEGCTPRQGRCRGNGGVEEGHWRKGLRQN